MVYGVFSGCYSDWYIVGYFNNRDDAEKYCCMRNTKYMNLFYQAYLIMRLENNSKFTQN